MALHESTKLVIPEQMRYAFEWPTWLAYVVFWIIWLFCIFNPYELSLGLLFPLLMLNLGWYMSLQHEFVHNHPTQSASFNRLLGLLPLCVWYPFDIYKESHLAHHRDEFLTLPDTDPESNYIYTEDWHKLSLFRKFLKTAYRTFLGRTLFGPALVIEFLLIDIRQAYQQKNTKQLRVWGIHLGLLVLLLLFIQRYAAIPVSVYLLAAYGGFGIALLRSLYEHRPAKTAYARIVINESSLFWRLVYLNNNYHLVHHAFPGLAWYLIPDIYRRQKADFLLLNEGFWIDGYWALMKENAIKPIDSVNVDKGYI